MMTQKRLKHLLTYNPSKGIFRWKNPVHGRVSKGKIAGWKEKKGYISIEIDGHTYKAHRLAWLYIYGRWPFKQIDHINRNKSDNKISNLREALQRDNSANMIRKNQSGFKGAYYQKNTGRYKAQICVNYKIIYLGLFETAEEANDAYCNAAIKYFGRYARAA